jgi:uncharacterized 2Fe-2S/4Fe-4S cluster protein (DUF4445 family)
MPFVTFLPSKRVAQAAAGADLLDVARAAGVEIEAPCGGKGSCGRCLVRVVGGSLVVGGAHRPPPQAAAEGYVLACQARVGDGPVSVEIPEVAAGGAGQFADGDETTLVRGELLPRTSDYDPLAVKWYLDVPPPQLGDGLSDLDRLTRRIQREWGPVPVLYPLAAIREAATALRECEGRVTVTLVREPGGLHVTRIESGDTTTRHFGAAVDIGTTTVAVQLVRLHDARILATRSDYNGQIPCGLDVISRINYARRPERLAELRGRVLDTINRLLEQVCRGQGVTAGEICNAVLSGNTTMTHLLLGLPPEFIRLAPYTPTILDAPYLTAGDVGLAIHPEAWVYLSPAVGSYVGGDITAGALCTDLATEAEAPSLFIDIGTNGELVVGNRDFLLTCACSAGPAFEGGGIECGMRAALGAIERVEVDPATGVPRCATIGGGPARGICGSGMISLLAELLRTGWMDPAGRLARDRSSPAIRVDGRQARYILGPAPGGAKDGGPLAVSELDIDNVRRAKAAIYAACSLLLRQAGLSFGDLAAVCIGGGFGRYLDLDQAICLGLLPDLPRERFRYIGNSSLLGSYMVLISQDFRRRQQELARRMTYIDLSSDPDYMEQYTAALFFPHTEPSLFPSVRGQWRGGSA